jgi:hypothetical protein
VTARPAVQRQLDALRQARRADVVEQSLKALEMVGAPDHEIRAAALEAYGRIAATRPSRDPGCHVRAALLRALGGRATAEDVPMLVSATDVYEYAPPAFTAEMAMMVRSAALVALSHVDPTLAAYHACAHLEDADEMSGEPALTAVRVLGAQDQLPPVYAYASAHEHGEVLAECLRQLTAAPAGIIDRLVQRHRSSADQAVLAGVVDLLLAHADPDQARRELVSFLASAPLDVFRYGATLLVARREVDLVTRLGADPAVAEDGARHEVFAEAATLLPPPRA